MPVEFGLWRIDGAKQRIVASPMASEARLRVPFTLDQLRATFPSVVEP